jgi:putative MATE family efflux protein
VLSTERDRLVRSYREILGLAFPVGLETIFQTSFGLADQVIVAFLGADAVAGVGLSNSVSFIFILLYSAIGTGCGVLVAKAFGRKDMEEVSAIATLGQIAAGTFGICTALVLGPFAGMILHWIGAQENVAAASTIYFRLFAASAPLSVTSAVTTATFRSLSDTRTPMLITTGAVTLNTLLGFFLVLGISPFPKLGLAGAGLATLLAQTVRCGALQFALHQRKYKMRWLWPWNYRRKRNVAKQLFDVTCPLALSELLWGASAFIYTVVFARFGTGAVAASQIVMVIENLLLATASGLAPAAVATIGQALGAGSARCAKKNAAAVLRLGLITGLLLTVLVIASSFLIPVLYPRVGGTVQQVAFWGLVIAASIQPAKVLNSILGIGILPSTGDMKFTLVGHLIGSYLVGLPAALFLGIFIGLNAFGVFGARAMEELVKVIAFLLRFKTGGLHRNPAR